MEDKQIVSLYWARDPQAIDRSQEKYGPYCLSIARSLTQLQHGTFSLTIDGDLFKAALTFPRIP